MFRQSAERVDWKSSSPLWKSNSPERFYLLEERDWALEELISLKDHHKHDISRLHSEIDHLNYKVSELESLNHNLIKDSDSRSQ